MFLINKKLLLLCFVIGCASVITAQLDAPKVGALPEVGKPAEPEEVHPPPETTSTTTTTTKKPTTTTTTTTHAPDPAPKTTTTTTTTTTPAPTTTSTAAPTTTTSTTPAPSPKPTPTPAPTAGLWNSSCIRLHFAAQLNFNYTTVDGKNASVLYNVPANATVHDAECSVELTQSLALTWGPNTAPNSLTLSFSNDNKTSYLDMMMFKIPIEGEQFPNAKANQTVNLLHIRKDFGVPVGMSYHCTRKQALNLTATVNDPAVIGVVELSQVQVEAFRKEAANNEFATAKDCDSSSTPDIVPIAVGIALCALILVVLVSYLVARRRSTIRGYMSF